MIGHFFLRAGMTAMAILAGIAIPVAAEPALAATPNLVPNAGIEQLDGAGRPVGWGNGSYGTNTRTLTVTTPGSDGTGHALRVDVTAYTDGAAYWSSSAAPLTGGKLYEVSDRYQSTVDGEIDARITRSNGTVSYVLVTRAPAASTWSVAKGQFIAPADATSVAVYHLIKGVGSLVADDFELVTDTGYGQGMVSVTIDDGWAPQYDVARPILSANGIRATFYIVSDLLGATGRLTAAQVQQIHADGHEIGSHTLTHPDLTTLSPAAVDLQLGKSRTDLEQLVGAPVPNFAYPYGAFNPTVQAACLAHYRTCRSTQYGYNTSRYDADKLVVRYIHNTTTQAEFESWIADARTTGSWLVLVYHSFETNPTKTDDTTPAALSAQLSYLATAGLPIRTVEEAATLGGPPPQDTTPPQTALTSPADGAGIGAGPITVTATATDDVGVTGVDLLVDGSLVESDATAPYAFTWTATAGAHTLRTRAHDAAANTGLSPVATVTVDALLYAETWSGGDGSAWPSAWTPAVTNGTVTTQGGGGRLLFNDVVSARAGVQLTGAPARADTELLTSYRWGQTTAVGWFTVFLRGSGPWANAWRPRNGYGIELSSNSATVTVEKTVNGASTNIQAVGGSQQVSTNKQWLRLRVSGAQIRFRTWVDGQPEPTTWRATVTDTTVTGPGQLYLNLARSSTNSGAKSVTLDDLTVREVSP